MPEDPNPLPPGATGTVVFVNDVDVGGHDRFTQLAVKWDRPHADRKLLLAVPPDSFEVLNAEEADCSD